MPSVHHRQVVIALGLVFGALCGAGAAAELLAGAATVSITPDKPVALSGQMRTRISSGVASPVTATVLMLESRDVAAAVGTTTFVSCDLVSIPDEVLAAVRAKVAESLPGFPVERIVVNATHTHTAPVMIEGAYEIAAAGVMQPAEYVDFCADRIAAGICEARRRCTAAPTRTASG